MDLLSQQIHDLQRQLDRCNQQRDVLALLIDTFSMVIDATQVCVLDLHPKPYQLASQKRNQACQYSAELDPDLANHIAFPLTRRQTTWYHQQYDQTWQILVWPAKVNTRLCIAFQAPLFSLSQLDQAPLFESVLRQLGYRLQLDGYQQVNVQFSAASENMEQAAQGDSKKFAESLILLQNINLQLSNADSLDQLHREAVESLRTPLNYDRAALFLLNPQSSTMNPTYGTDEQGNTTDEHSHVYDMHKMSPLFMHTCLHTQEYFVVLEDVPLFSDQNVVGHGWNAMLVLRDGSNLLGWIALDNLINQRPITPYDKELLRSFAYMFSQILVRKRAEENLKMLYNSSETLSAAKTELDVCYQAVSLAQQQLMLDRVAIFLSDDNGATIRGTYGTDLQGNIVDETWYNTPTPKTDLIKQAIQNEDVLAIEDPATLYHNNRPVGTGWNAILQLRSNHRVIGFLFADNLINGYALSLHAQQLIRIFGTTLSEMLARKQAEQNLIQLNKELEQKVTQRTQQLEASNQALANTNAKLNRLIITDPLTGVANRRSLDSSLQLALQHACRQQLSLHVVMFDIDFFKSYNDHYGHLEGDETLKQVAALLSQHFRRADDSLARFGGEEFALVIQGQPQQEVIERVNQAIHSLADLAIPNLHSELGKVTISAGMTTLDLASPPSVNTLLNQADIALYQAKRQGKNRLALFRT
ncbi:GGDEF domain-containing protein [Motilimonas eburnea]|uniref:GGDEF domain-containing protein n=1 Tax=Motilimonas eburnea TaxID=1737488 RepID=UPI001E3DC109|nr:sensor domain-containing diguanylate cyclase [Motilimonas eburnea]MCE2573116.1 sensor domain-containing diguanylate cyclase [Motilimonas eburnea]